MAWVDFETFSETDLPTVGYYRYAEDRSTEILVVSYQLESGLSVTTMSDGDLDPLFQAVQSGERVVAHNAHFERAIWELVSDWPVTPHPGQWSCTAARCSALALPRSLEAAAVALKLDITKNPKGKALINLFSKPQKDGSRVFPKDNPQAFREFQDYCEQDVIVEKRLDQLLPDLPGIEPEIFQLDYQINARGVPIDIPAIRKAIAFVKSYEARINQACQALTGLNLTQRDKLMAWVQTRLGIKLENFTRETLEELLKTNLPKEVRQLLLDRIESARAGTKKLVTMLTCASSDDRVRGAFWYGAASTGRWGSSGPQFHNFSKGNEDFDPAEVIDNLDLLDVFYEQPLTALAANVRGFIKAREGRKLYVGDYSAIEARVLAWLARESWLVKAFAENRPVYEEMAASIYGVPVKLVTELQRFFGKQVILGCGYGMGAQKLQETCARFGQPIDLPEAKRLISLYREKTPAITRFRYNCEDAAVRTVLTGRPHKVGVTKFRMLELSNGPEFLLWDLPSGRYIAYPEPEVRNEEKWGKILPTLYFRTYYRGMWVEESTYSGKLTENVTQAVSRDLLAEGMASLEANNYPVFIHVHDEAGSEVQHGSKEEFERLMCRVRPWANTLPLLAKAKVRVRYGK